MKIYFDWRDRWVGWFDDPELPYHYVCVLPCIVIRWRRRS